MISPNDILLTDQVAVVTGGAMGIGAGIAKGLASFGAHIVIADIDVAAAEKTAALIREQGRQVLVVATDVMDKEQIKAMVAKTIAHFGRLDIFVNNVGGVRSSRFMDLSERSRERHVQINLMNLLACTEAAARAMIDRGQGGNIINITSIEGQRAAPMFSVYAACKAAMNSFTRTTALELAEHGIRVNTIAPDIVDTEGARTMNPGFYTADTVARRSKYIPLGRDGIVDEIASAAVFLASRMANYVTGAVLNVDGGTSASSGWLKSDDGGWSLYPGNFS
ncbi:MAG: SDR family oxidoreductase, partial [Spongiibacteraceae bacterium]